MQTNATIAAAAVAQERTPIVTLKVDWDNDGTYSQTIDDVSARVESVTIQRQLATDLPDAVARSAGYSSAQLDATLSGDPATEATNAAAYFSPFNTTSALYGKRRRWRTCQVQMGFNGATVPVFTGKTTELTVDVASRSAGLQALDNAETMRAQIDLPLVIATDNAALNPGLNASWVVDYVARRCGFNAAPPSRPNCLWGASFAGSAYPNIGGLIAANDLQFVTGQFINAATVDYGANSPTATYSTVGSASTNDGGELLIEGWFNPSILGGYHSFIQVTSDYTSATAPQVNMTELQHASTADTLGVSIRRTAGGASVEYDSGITLPANAMNYLACHVYFTSTTVYFHWRLGSTSASTTASTSSVTGQPSLTQVNVGHGYASFGVLAQGAFNIEAAQVSNPGSTTSAPSWNNAYVGNAAITPSLNNLTVTVPGLTGAWDQIQQIAAAELATTGFDEAGNFFYYNRNRWLSSPWTTSQRTIQASDSLTALATSEAIDQVRNHVRITGSPAGLQKASYVWATSDVISVAASSSTTITADLGTPVYGLGTTISYASASNPSGNSIYRASRNRVGGGGNVSNLTFTVTVIGAQIVTITITNPNAYVVYLVSGTGFTDPAGTPALALWGRAVTYDQAPEPDATAAYQTAWAKRIAEASDSTSIGQHGEQLLEITGNPWLQDITSLGTLASDLLARLKDPPAILDGLTIVADPRLQLGDRVTVVGPTLGLNGDFFITGITTTFDASGATQALTTRAV